MQPKDPTPKQIARKCQTIRSKWTADQERHRRGVRGNDDPAVAARVPAFTTEDLERLMGRKPPSE